MLEISPDWEFVSDQVMGGVSSGFVQKQMIARRQATCLKGDVSLENNGGFVQMAFNFNPNGQPLDVSSYAGIELDVYGNAEDYDIRLRTDELNRAWQSYRFTFNAPKEWTTVRCQFCDFTPHRTDVAMSLNRLCRLGVVAIGRKFTANISVSAVRLVKV
jgi:hypothetical protein